MTIRHYLLFVLSLTLITCNQISHTGLYVASGFEKTIDTLEIFQDGRYRHIIYDGNRLVYINIGTWEEKGNEISFKKFLYNKDNQVYRSEHQTYDNVLLTAYFQKALLSSDLIIDRDFDMYYNKIKNYNKKE